MRLIDLWKSYEVYGDFNIYSLPDELIKKGTQV